MTRENQLVKVLGIIILIFTTAMGVKAQTLIAEYPFNNTLAASTGNFGNAVIGTAGCATLGSTSICTDNINQSFNGLATPNLTTLSQSSFQIDLSFNLTSLPTTASNNHTIFVIGQSVRYFGLTVNSSGKLKVLFNNANVSMDAVGITITPGVDYNIRLQYISGITKLEINNQLYLDIQLPTLTTETLKQIYIGDNPGSAFMTEACFSNLKIYNNPIAFTSTSQITPSPNSLSGFTTCLGVESASQITSISGSNLSSDISIAAPTGFQISLDNITYSTSLTLAQSGGTVNSTNIYVKTTSTIPGSISGTLTMTSGLLMRFVSLSATISTGIITGGINVLSVGGTTTFTGSSSPSASAHPSTPWTSSNPARATVSSSGVVTGVAVGQVNITYMNNLGCTGTRTIFISGSSIVYANSTTGNNVTGDGTIGNPVKTFHTAHQIVQAGGTINLDGTFNWSDADESGDNATTGYSISKNLTITGTGAEQTIIQAAATASTTNRRVFTINNATVVFNNLTIRHGNLTTAADGAGLLNNTGIVTMNNCRITSNSTAIGNGGGVRHQATSTFTANGCTFDGNSASSGGAFANGDVTNLNKRFDFINCTFYNNTSTATTATVGGGAVWVVDGTNSTITNCTFSNNNIASGTGKGASILIRTGSLRIKNSIFVNGKKGGLALTSSNSEINTTGDGGSCVDEGNNIFGRQDDAFMTLSNSSYYDSNTSTAVDGSYTLNNSSPEQFCTLTISNTLALNSATNGIVTLETSGINQNSGSILDNNGITIPGVDQRGVSRTNLPDIGSFESSVAAPVVTVSATSLTAISTCTGSPSTEESFTVSGTSLVANITITAPTGFQISTTSGTGFANSLVLTQTGGVVNTTTIYVRLTGASSGSPSGNISVGCNCTGNQNVAVNGIVTDTYTWTGATSTDPNNAANWNPASVPCSSANEIIPTGLTNYPSYTNLTINSGTTFTVQSGAKIDISGVLTNNGTMTIESGATLVQGSSSTLAGSGTYNVLQSITGANNGTAPNGRFWYLGSPVATSSSSVLFANTANVVKKRDEATNAWIALASGTPENLSVGRGYYTQAMANSTVTFTGGNINNGTVNISNLSRTSGVNFEGFNLVSNPYPSYLDWDLVTKTNIGNTMWYRTATGNTAGSMVFETYVAGAAGGIGTNLSGDVATKLIPPMQAFWVRVNQGQTTGSLTLNNSMRSHFSSISGSTAGLRSTNDELKVFLRMNLLQEDKKDQLIVYMNGAATNGFDILDGEKMMQAGTPQFYTKAGDKKIVINGLNSAKKQHSLPIIMELPTTGVHTFEIENLELETGLVWLEDKQEEIIQALEPGTVYEFYAASGMDSERFVLHFQLIDDAVPTNVYNEVNSSANFSGKGANVHAEAAGVVVIKLPASNEGVTDIQIRDAAGRLVYTGSTNTLETSVQLSQANGIYYVTLNSNAGVEVRKVFIQQ